MRGRPGPEDDDADSIVRTMWLWYGMIAMATPLLLVLASRPTDSATPAMERLRALPTTEAIELGGFGLREDVG